MLPKSSINRVTKPRRAYENNAPEHARGYPDSLSTSHQHMENQSCTRKLCLGHNHNGPACCSSSDTDGTAETTPAGHIFSFKVGEASLAQCPAQETAAQMVLGTSDPSSSLASTWSDDYSPPGLLEVEGIKGWASLTHSYTGPQPSQDTPAVHEDYAYGKKGEGEGSTFLHGNIPLVKGRKTRSSFSNTSH